MPFSVRPLRKFHLIPLFTAVIALAWAPAPVRTGRGALDAPTGTTARTAAAPIGALTARLAADAHGRSGTLRVRIADAGARVALPLAWDGPHPADVEYHWLPTLGTGGPVASGRLDGRDRAVAPTEPGVYELELTEGAARRAFHSDLRLLVRVPFDRKRRGYIGHYLLGRWPTEGKGRTDRYAPPKGFIRVTRANAGLRLSDHFTLGEFLTHDQSDVWPKYVVVQERLLEKLELVLQQLEASGIPARHMVIMSGFRAPEYNRKGLSNGRATLSRHQYGDAADVWVDNDGDWYMDDLNGDGRRDIADARVMLRAVNQVERAHPDLVGGAGVYRDNGAHGPFIHIDARGKRARW